MMIWGFYEKKKCEKNKCEKKKNVNGIVGNELLLLVYYLII